MGESFCASIADSRLMLCFLSTQNFLFAASSFSSNLKSGGDGGGHIECFIVSAMIAVMFRGHHGGSCCVLDGIMFDMVVWRSGWFPVFMVILGSGLVTAVLAVIGRVMSLTML